MSKEFEDEELVLVKVSTNNGWEKNNSGSHSCSNGAVAQYRITRNFKHNFDKFNQSDFDLYSTFTAHTFKCKGQGSGWNKTEENIWHAYGTEFATNWGDWEQNGTIEICKKGSQRDDPLNCVKTSF